MLKDRVLKNVIFIGMLFFVTPIIGQNYDFKSYHLYTTDEDKYSSTNVQNAAAKVCLDEDNQEIELSLYHPKEGSWKIITMRIYYKANLGLKSKFGTFYMCKNTSGQTCSVYISNTEEGFFIDLHNVMQEQFSSCWVRKEPINIRVR